MEYGSPDEITLREVTSANWREALGLEVHPEQQRFVAAIAPVAAIALAKAYVRAAGAIWLPYAIYAGATMVGFLALAHEPERADSLWIFHFFIDQRYQGRGYGTTTLVRLIELVNERYPECRTLCLVVHPENRAAQRLYTRAGFRPTGAERWGEPEYQLALRDDWSGEE